MMLRFSFHPKTTINFSLLPLTLELTEDFHDLFQIWVRFVHLKPKVMIKIYTSLLATLLFSCSTRLNYLGTSSTPTKKVDVYVDPSAIKRPYTIMGKGYQESNIISKERMQEQAVMKAKEKGADAVLFVDYFITDNEVYSYSMLHPDSTGKALKMNNRSPSAVVNSQVSILFLKYQ